MKSTLPQQRRLKKALDIIASHDIYNKGFDEWIGNNWHVYEAFEVLANEVWGAGRSHYSAKSLWETMRFYMAIEETHNTESEFKLNNNWHSQCARLYVGLNPTRKGFFEFRCRRGWKILAAA